MNIVTGYRGFIGSHICDHVNNIFAVEQDDCYDFLDGFAQWDRVQMVYHMGAISDTTCNDVAKLYHYNVNFTIRLLEKCIQHGVPLRYASSASVYGNTPVINPLNQYAMSKATVDLWLQDNIERFTHVQALRFFNVYGDGEEHKRSQASPVTQFRQQIANTGVIQLFEGSDNYVRDFICVEDVVDIAVNNTLGSGVYDVGTSKPVSFAHVAKLIQAKHGGKIVTVPFPNHLRSKYQYYTCAIPQFDYTFKPIEEWLGV